MSKARLMFVVGIAVTAGCKTPPSPTQLPAVAITSNPIQRDIVGHTRIDGPGTSPGLVFGSMRTGPQQFRPVIVVSSTNGWELIDTDVIELDGHMWMHVAHSTDGQRVWAIADHVVEGPGWNLEIVASDDAGMSFHHAATVRKPDYWALFESFTMDSRGRGELSVTLESGHDDASIPDRLINKLPTSGRYTYTTKDWGATWRGPKFEEVVLEEGLDVDETMTLEQTLESLQPESN